MIQGVHVKQLTVHGDVLDPKERAGERLGVLMEIVRDDDELLSHFGQTLMTVAHKGAIKGFHWHKKQDDVWFVATGRARIVLHDLREGSPTKGETTVLHAGGGDYKAILIPRGVAHAYEVLSDEPVLLFYHTTVHYEPKNPDELRIPHDDPRIGFDWSKQ